MDEEQFGKGSADRPEDYFGERAWRHEEIAAAFRPAVWVEKNPLTGFETYPKRNQLTQSSCVSYSLAKQLAVDEFSENGEYREMSPRSIYPFTFVPGGGSNAIVATKLATKQGMTLEHLLKTDGLTEEAVRKADDYKTDAKQVAFVYKPGSFIECTTDFETIASILQNFKDEGKKKVVTASVVGTNNGTWLSMMPRPPKAGEMPWYHRISITDFGLINGRKFLSFDNSWGEECGNKGQQFLSDEYAPFVYGGIYTLNMLDNWQQVGSTTPPPPTYEWTKDLRFGDVGPDVVALQEALRSLGMFPVVSIVKPTGNFFGITKKGVELFQSAFGLPITGMVDMTTRKKLNEIF